MSYIGIKYICVILPAVIILYYLMPKKIKPIVLLSASYAFFFYISRKLIFYLLISSLSIYLAGLWMKKIDQSKEEKIACLEKEEKKALKEKYKHKKKIVLIFTVLFNLSFLFFFKYLPFFTNITNGIFNAFSIDCNFKIVKHLAPIGISFYTLQAISYLVDVYNEKVIADRNIIKVFLYLAFFPTIMEGPITRFNEVSEDLYNGNKITYKNLCFGYQRILFGTFKKCVIADRLNIFVKLVFKNYLKYSGITIALGTIFYTILLYMEFSGTMDVVIGSAEIFGIKIPENFRQPFFSKNISEFWSRWHISLGLWFKNYIFYPVSLSKPVKKLSGWIRKVFGNRVSSLVMGAIALFAVWSLNGLWHGAGWTFVFFGYYHFILILMGNIFEPIIAKLCEKWHINRKKKPYQIIQIIKTSILVFIGELFFRAPTLTNGFGMIKRIITEFNLKQFKVEFFTLGLDIKDYIILVIALIIIIAMSLLREHGVNIRENVSKKNIVLRWTIYYALILSIIIFGAYGQGYKPVEPIYADF